MKPLPTISSPYGTSLVEVLTDNTLVFFTFWHLVIFIPTVNLACTPQNGIVSKVSQSPGIAEWLSAWIQGLLVAGWLRLQASTAAGAGSIPDQRTKILWDRGQKVLATGPTKELPPILNRY